MKGLSIKHLFLHAISLLTTDFKHKGWILNIAEKEMPTNGLNYVKDTALRISV